MIAIIRRSRRGWLAYGAAVPGTGVGPAVRPTAVSVRCPAGHPVPVVDSIARDPSLRARLFYRRLGPVEAVVVNGVRQMRSTTTQAPFPLLRRMRPATTRQFRRTLTDASVGNESRTSRGTTPALMSRPIASCPTNGNVRISASPRCPALLNHENRHRLNGVTLREPATSVTGSAPLPSSILCMSRNRLGVTPNRRSNASVKRAVGESPT